MKLKLAISITVLFFGLVATLALTSGSIPTASAGGQTQPVITSLQYNNEELVITGQNLIGGTIVGTHEVWYYYPGENVEHLVVGTYLYTPGTWTDTLIRIPWAAGTNYVPRGGDITVWALGTESLHISVSQEIWTATPTTTATNTSIPTATPTTPATNYFRSEVEWSSNGTRWALQSSPATALVKIEQFGASYPVTASIVVTNQTTFSYPSAPSVVLLERPGAGRFFWEVHWGCPSGVNVATEYSSSSGWSMRITNLMTSTIYAYFPYQGIDIEDQQILPGGAMVKTNMTPNDGGVILYKRPGARLESGCGSVDIDVSVSPWYTTSPTPSSTPSPTPTPTATAIPVPTTVHEVRDVRVSNVTDESFTVSFVSNSSALPALAIWESGVTTTQLVKDFRSDPGETHWYQAVGLKPTTTYQYAIYWGGMTVYQGVVQTKAKGTINTPRLAFGQVTDQTNHPVYDALVYLTEDGNGLLSAVTDENGWWSVDLNSARPQTSGSFKALGGPPTPLIRIEATAGSAGSAIATVPSDFAWPLNLNLRPVVTRKLALGSGWNAVAMPLEPFDVAKVSDLARLINGDGVTRLSAVYGYDSSWQGTIVSGTSVLGEDLRLLVGRGYFFQMDHPFEWNLSGFTVTQAIPLYLQSGWNLVGVPNPGLTAYDLSDASGIISGTTTHNVAEVDRWTYGHYDGHVAGYPFNNFSIDPDRAYFVRANRWGRLNPGVGFTPLQ